MNKPKLAELSQFTGTEGYTRLQPFPLLLTDGTLFLAQNADCFWLFTEIAMAQSLPKIKNDEKLRDMQFWQLKPHGQGSGATLICERDSDDVAYTKQIEYTDFPFDAVKDVRIWVAPTAMGENDKLVQVAYLPSEH